MAKVAFFLPGSISVETVRNEIGSFSHIEPVMIEQPATKDLADYVRQAIVKDCCVFVARGLQAELLKNMSALPVVPLRITGQELGILIRQICQERHLSSPQVALVDVASMFCDTSRFEELFGVRIRSYIMHDRDDAQELVQQAVADGADFIIGGRHICEVARELHVPAYFASGGTESLRETLETVEKICILQDLQSREAAETLTMIDNNFNGIMKISQSGLIEMVNLVMESILGKEAFEVEGKPLVDILPGFEMSYIEAALKDAKTTFSYMMRIHDMGYAVNISPASVDGKVTCVYLTFQEQEQIRQLDHKLRKEMYREGRFARSHFDQYHWKSRAMLNAEEMAKRISRFSAPVLIVGERGTEKSLFAQCIHSNSLISDGPFVAGECSAWSNGDMESHLFGIGQERESLLEMAQGGTLYLKNVEKLSMENQYVLHSLLSGGPDLSGMELYNASNTRVIATSEEDLAVLVQQGLFRSDLYYELTVVQLKLVPLRKRKEDLEFYIPYYMDMWEREYSRHVHLSKGAMDAMVEYDWPGNVQQLANFCQRILLYADRREISEVFVRQQLKDAYPEFISDRQNQVVSVVDKHSAELEQLLEEYHGNRQKVADALGISKTTLWRRMKKYGIAD